MPASQATVSVLSPTAQFGLNVFEGIRGYWSEKEQEIYLFKIKDHLKRLTNSCKLMGIRQPYDANFVVDAIRAVLMANDYHCDVAVRVTFFVDGEGTWSTSDPVDMFVAPVKKARLDKANLMGKSAAVSTFERIDDRVMPPRIKVGANYINGRYAHMEVQACGYDLPILLDRHGKVSEGAGACLMMVRDGVLVTPTISSSILESITRDTILTLAREAGQATEVREIDRTELYLAEEVFLCGSAAEITPVISVDQYCLGDGTPGSLTRSLLADYLKAASGGRVDWVTPVWHGYESKE